MAYLVARMAGLRQAELLGLRWYSIDWQAMEIRAALREDVKLHGLRHTFATRLAAAGVPLVKLQEWLGHEDIAIPRSTSTSDPGSPPYR